MAASAKLLNAPSSAAVDALTRHEDTASANGDDAAGVQRQGDSFQGAAANISAHEGIHASGIEEDYDEEMDDGEDYDDDEEYDDDGVG
jgi:hypothetical protein